MDKRLCHIIASVYRTFLALGERNLDTKELLYHRQVRVMSYLTGFSDQIAKRIKASGTVDVIE
jgi:hypothetical protein